MSFFNSSLIRQCQIGRRDMGGIWPRQLTRVNVDAVTESTEDWGILIFDGWLGPSRTVTVVVPQISNIGIDFCRFL